MTRAIPRRSVLSGALSSLPDFRGKGRVVEAVGRVASHVGSARVACSIAPGVSLELDLRDRIQRQMWGGCYEQHVQRCVDCLLQPGDTFLDVGAHIGFHAARGAQELLAHSRPMLLLEMNDVLLRQAGSSSWALADALVQQRYRLFGLAGNSLEPWNSAAPVCSEAICLPEESWQAAVAALRQRRFACAM